MNEFQFFRDATHIICGSLEIDRSLSKLVLFLQDFFPVERVFLQRYNRKLGAMQAIAAATGETAEMIDVLIPVSSRAKIVPRLSVAPAEADVRIFNDPAENPLCREMMKFLDCACSALMVLRLHLQGEVMGSFVVSTGSGQQYTENDADSLALIREPAAIALSNYLAHHEIVRLKELLADDNTFFRSELRRMSGDTIIGANFGLKNVMRKVYQVAAIDSPVLLTGETGTGKDVIATALHHMSHRHENPFIAVNCGAIPETLIDSELFGHERGAFTGAVAQKRGRFERADRGTIFLDEIAELPMTAQARLLRVLQHKSFERVGGQETLHADVRIIAATNRELVQMVERGEFREDLFFRLNVFPIHIPPLRERLSDIPALVEHFLHIKAGELKLSSVPSLADDAIDDLMAYAWRGNVRELQNVVERALIINPGGPVHFRHLEQTGKTAAERDSSGPPHSPVETLDMINRRHIISVLEKTGGKIHGPGGAAELCGVNASTLRNRMKKLGIPFLKQERIEPAGFPRRSSDDHTER